MVAGIISATQNTVGIAGITQCQIHTYGNAISQLNSAMTYAANNGIKILNASFTYTGNFSFTYIYNQYSSFDGIIICAAGNEMQDLDQNPLYPACFDLPNIITVGASTSNGTIANYSNWGLYSVDLFAPGDNILSTYPISMCSNNCDPNKHFSIGYHKENGTSLSTAFVTGVVALIQSYCPSITPIQIKNHIINNLTLNNQLALFCHNAGVLNAYASLGNTAIYVFTGDVTFHHTNCSICNTSHLSNPQAHSYSPTYVYYSYSHHHKVCSGCGHEYIQSHQSNGVYLNQGTNVGHKTYCTICNHDYTEPHTWIFNNLDMKYHCLYCPAKSSSGWSPVKYDGEIE